MVPYRRISWLSPASCWPPHKVTKPERVKELIRDVEEFDWWGDALVGYRTYDGREQMTGVQLLTGPHIWAAMEWLGMKIPVVLLDEEEVEAAWGDPERWAELMKAGREAAWLISANGGK